MSTPNLGLQTVPSNTLQPSIPVNDHLQVIDALLQGAVQGTLAAPPSTAAADAGKVWIVGASATGAWAGHDATLALCTGAGLWRFLTPRAGWSLRSVSTGRWWQFNGSAWTQELRVEDLGAALTNYADDAAAAAAGVAVGGLYRTSSTVKVRVS
ncbi:hypothetical protein GGR77_001502 [Xanthomonas translucens]